MRSKVAISDLNNASNLANVLNAPVKLDMNEDIRRTTQENVYRHYRKRLFFEYGDSEENLQMLHDSYSEMARMDIRESGVKRFKDAPLARAVGLWLWDKVHCENVTAYRAGELFSATWDDKLEPDSQFLDAANLQRAYRTTAECIEEVAVKPFTVR